MLVFVLSYLYPKANIYGLIVLYSSFFFEPGIRKLRYPVVQADGSLTTVTVSMLDDVVRAPTSHPLAEPVATDTITSNNGHVIGQGSSTSLTRTIGLREDFELYKANTLAAFDYLADLAHGDDLLRVTLLAVKLFAEDALPHEMRGLVGAARQAYLVFLWHYLRWRCGPRRLRQATELYARLLIAFVDLRTLELRMTEFAKLLSLEGLSPLMREVCSQRAAATGSSATSRG
ncbi:unnamed protein product [Protopolystoma xenopodis]|uniref:Uncharacterized protein n=1 Tax=Protopolystoma xenopodis TaxID=117903 RepID=A0A3S4ZUY6_9PLAT|nr:unnamed protein product [Protopolystoma xenopodis]